MEKINRKQFGKLTIGGLLSLMTFGLFKSKEANASVNLVNSPKQIDLLKRLLKMRNEMFNNEYCRTYGKTMSWGFSLEFFNQLLDSKDNNGSYLLRYELLPPSGKQGSLLGYPYAINDIKDFNLYCNLGENPKDIVAVVFFEDFTPQTCFNSINVS